MHIDNMMQALKILIRVDTMIADIQFKARLSQIAFMAAALLIFVFALIMVGVAGFQYLKELWGPALAALAVAGGSLVVAALLAAFAAYKSPRKELQMAQELHKTALDTLIAEAKIAGSDFSLANRLLQGRFDTSLLAMIGPLATLLLRFLRKTGSDKPEGKAAS